MAPAVTATVVDGADPQNYEDEHVHAVYDQIAPHFSSTRYKPWPIIAQFLSSLPTGWVGLDSGTGNGKYLPLPSDRPGSVWTVGLDRSRNLLKIAQTAGGNGILREVVWGDVLGRSWRDGAFDYAISIATIHHLATWERRKAAVQILIQAVSPSHGRALIYVWAIEQDDLSKRNIPQGEPSHIGGQDVFVPWVVAQGQLKQKPSSGDPPLEAPKKAQDNSPSPVFKRYYHMFAKGELTQLVQEAATDMALAVGPDTGEKAGSGIEIVQDGWERSNYYVELRRWECA
ncbi:S-adenosyl-L-methionine-dependent methyltransferase [Trametopsis cervina]|nr:S-adenosyl-L-methionine-dependent methyltransferase [Trametopsis cervina]